MGPGHVALQGEARLEGFPAQLAHDVLAEVSSLMTLQPNVGREFPAKETLTVV